MSNIVELEPKKAQALQMLLVGEKGVYEIAEIVGVVPSTVYRWMQLPEFKDAIEQKETLMLDNLWHIALYKMSDLLINGKPYEQIQIIQQLSKLKGKEYQTVKVEKTLTLEDLLADL